MLPIQLSSTFKVENEAIYSHKVHLILMKLSTQTKVGLTFGMLKSK
jgi:hypothetical protein